MSEYQHSNDYLNAINRRIVKDGLLKERDAHDKHDICCCIIDDWRVIFSTEKQTSLNRISSSTDESTIGTTKVQTIFQLVQCRNHQRIVKDGLLKETETPVTRMIFAAVSATGEFINREANAPDPNIILDRSTI